ncbi:MAG: response regulator transcription factor [Halobacteriovoraceae bacterium]|nr:response regulator transcription factor [Halobacteriovoraceae bacterium]
MMMTKVLIVEDETNLGATLKEYLKTLEYDTFWADTVSNAKELFKSEDPNIVLMDIGLPDGNGLDLAREFRNQRKDFALLFLSALNDPQTKVEGLEIGAEDYITKPFALKELVLRLNKILGQQAQAYELPKELIFGPLKIWFKKYEVQDAHGEIIPLSQKECAILQLLYKEKGNVLSREEIIENIWSINDSYPSNRTVDNYIVKLRKWCETDEHKNLEIQSVRSIGYKLIIKEDE